MAHSPLLPALGGGHQGNEGCQGGGVIESIFMGEKGATTHLSDKMKLSLAGAAVSSGTRGFGQSWWGVEAKKPLLRPVAENKLVNKVTSL